MGMAAGEVTALVHAFNAIATPVKPGKKTYAVKKKRATT